MMVYILGFLGSILLIYYAETKRFTGQLAKTCVFFGLMIPCLIAGLRAETIGTDVRGYLMGLFDTAKSSETWSAFMDSGYSQYGWDYTAVSDMEIGFSLLTFLVQRVFGSLQVLMFIVQALTIIPIYKGLRAFSNSQPVWLGMTVYFLMYYNQTLNMMRQWIAMAFLLYAFQFLANRKTLKYFMMVLIASLFHVTAVVGVAIFAIYRLVAKENAWSGTIKVLLLILLGLVSLFLLDTLAALLDIMGLHHGLYIQGTLNLMPNQFLYRIPIVLILLWRWKYFRDMDPNARFYLVMIAYDIIAAQLVGLGANSGRIALFFGEYYLLAYPAVCAASTSENNRKLLRAVVLCYLCVYWWYVYVYGGANETVPYVSIFA